jgi:hypothetical protein
MCFYQQKLGVLAVRQGLQNAGKGVSEAGITSERPLSSGQEMRVNVSHLYTIVFLVLIFPNYNALTASKGAPPKPSFKILPSPMDMLLLVEKGFYCAEKLHQSNENIDHSNEVAVLDVFRPKNPFLAKHFGHN